MNRYVILTKPYTENEQYNPSEIPNVKEYHTAENQFTNNRSQNRKKRKRDDSNDTPPQRKKRKIQFSKDIIKNEILQILHHEKCNTIEEGVAIETITEQLSDISLTQTLEALEELQDEARIYSTYDDNHYKIME